MELLFENEFIAIHRDVAINVVKAVWSTNTEKMQNDAFKACVKAIWANVQQHKPIGFVGDTRNFLFSIHPSVQEWYGANIDDTFGSGTNKVAMIMSKHFIEQLSIEQTIEEDKTKGVTTQYFDNEEQAIKWAST